MKTVDWMGATNRPLSSLQPNPYDSKSNVCPVEGPKGKQFRLLRREAVSVIILNHWGLRPTHVLCGCACR